MSTSYVQSRCHKCRVDGQLQKSTRNSVDWPTKYRPNSRRRFNTESTFWGGVDFSLSCRFVTLGVDVLACSVDNSIQSRHSGDESTSSYLVDLSFWVSTIHRKI